MPSKIICKQQWDVELRATPGPHSERQNKAQTCQSPFLSLGLLRKTFPLQKMELSCKSTRLLTTLEGHEQFCWFFFIVFLFISSLCHLSEWSHSLSLTSPTRRITENPSPSRLGRKGSFGELSKAELLQSERSLSWGPGSLVAMAAPIPRGDELSQAPPAFLGNSASYPELQADGAAPQSGVTLDPNWGCCAHLQVMWTSTNVKADLWQRNLFSPQPTLQE